MVQEMQYNRLLDELNPVQPIAFYGADGEEEEPPVVEEPEPQEEAPPAPEAVDDDAESLAEIKKLRQEMKSLRARTKQAEGELKTREDAEKSELERAAAEREEFRTQSEALASKVKDLELTNVVLAVASKLNFADPADARALLDVSNVTFDEDTGAPSATDVNTELKKIAKAKPYLLRTSTGSGDGGPKDPPEDKDPFQANVDKYEKQFAGQGMVEIPQ